MTATVLKDYVGAITKVIETAGTFYASLDRTFHEQVKNKEFIEYDAVLTGGHNTEVKSIIRCDCYNHVIWYDRNMQEFEEPMF